MSAGDSERSRGREGASHCDAPASGDPVRRILVPALVIAALFGGLVAGARWSERADVPPPLRPAPPSRPLAHDPAGHGDSAARQTVGCPGCCAEATPAASEEVRKPPHGGEGKEGR